MTEVAAVPVADDDETQIRKAIEAFGRAVRAKDLDAIMALYTPDIVSFDLVPPLMLEGIEAYRKQWADGLSMMTGDIGFETHDLRIHVGRDVAFCHALTFWTSPMGDNWMRWTGGLQKIRGKWLIAHEHISWPTDPESSKSLMDLKP